MKFSEKNSEDIKTRITYETKLEMQRLAHAAGMSESEYLRTVIMFHCYGKEEMINRQLRILNSIAGSDKP